jgi:hypothetical protein
MEAADQTAAFPSKLSKWTKDQQPRLLKLRTQNGCCHVNHKKSRNSLYTTVIGNMYLDKEVPSQWQPSL